MPFMFFSPTYMMFMIPCIILTMLAQWMVSSAFAKWKRVANASGMSGAEAAHALLYRSGLNDIQIEQVGGTLSDHYDPRARVLRLSSDVYQGRSVASIGVALHEAGHALQHAQNYAPLAMRSALVPAMATGSQLAWVLIIVGLFIQALHGLAIIGLLLFGAVVLFSFVTLPVELNASSRAKAAAVELGIVSPGREASGVSQVLNAAALTYVAAAATALMQFLYYALLIFGGRRN